MGHNKAEFDFLGAFTSIFNILLQLFRVFIRDISIRMAYPELFQVPGHTMLAKLRCAESAKTMQAFYT